LAWITRTVPAPSAERACAQNARAIAGVDASCPNAVAWHVSMQNATRSGSATEARMLPRCSSGPPRFVPLPTVFSMHVTVR
jgi:hypothetical protein